MAIVTGGAGRGLPPGRLSRMLADLNSADLATLRAQWQRLFRAPAPAGFNRDLLQRDVAYRLQERAAGGLSRAVNKRLTSIAAAKRDGKATPPVAPPRLRPGVTLVREWHGQTHAVVVLDGGFEYQGRRHASLTEIARQITGAKWSGPRFFGLTRSVATIAPVPPPASSRATHAAA